MALCFYLQVVVLFPHQLKLSLSLMSASTFSLDNHFHLIVASLLIIELGFQVADLSFKLASPSVECYIFILERPQVSLKVVSV